ncbi:hypothetical protein ACFQVA_18765 [Actinomadura keratinilytica]
MLTLLRQSDGSPALPVVRGWLPGAADPDAAPAAAQGRGLAERRPPGARAHPLARRVQGRRPPRRPGGHHQRRLLVNLVPYPVENAWVTLTDGQPGNAGLTPVPPAATPDSGLDLKAFQNLGYTGEWFVFAGFVVFMWFRLLRRDAEVARDEALGIAPEGPPQPVTPGPSAAARLPRTPPPRTASPRRRRSSASTARTTMPAPFTEGAGFVVNGGCAVAVSLRPGGRRCGRPCRRRRRGRWWPWWGRPGRRCG